MLHATEPFLFRSSHELSVAQEACGGITVIGVEAEDQHGEKLKS
jgi:hypothetical protein